MRLVYFTLGWVIGIFLAAQFAFITPRMWAFFMLGATLAVIFVQNTRYRWLFLAILWLTLGALRFSVVPKTSDIAQYNGKNVSIEGVVADEPDIRDQSITLRIEANAVFDGANNYVTSGLVLVTVPRITDVLYGDRVKVGGALRLPGQFDTFSYTDFLARDGIFSLMRDATLEIINRGEGSPFYSAIFALKTQTQAVIARYLPEPHAGLLTGILLGNQRGLSPALGDDFSAVGASHIIAISGFNMAIISGVVMGLLERLRVGKRWAAFIGIGFLVLYTILVGAGATVFRAALMSSLLIIAPLLNRKTFIPSTLAFVVLLLTLQNPSAIWDISFQLSFLAVLGLALFVEPLQKLLDRALLTALPTDYARTASNFLSDALIVTLAAQIATLPLMLLYFQRLSLVALAVNMLIIPMQSVLMVLGAIATLVGFVLPFLAQILFFWDILLLGWTIAIVRLFADLPFADAPLALDARVVGLYYVLLIVGAIMTATRSNVWGILGQRLRARPIVSVISAAGVGIVMLLWAIVVSRPDGKLHVWWLDVGHTHAVLIQTPNGAHILVDGGRNPSRLLTALGDRLPFYDREIEVLILTQPDDFDNGAIPSVLARYSTGIVLTNGQPNQSEIQAEIQSLLQERKVFAVQAGYNLVTQDGVTIEILNPQKTPQLSDNLADNTLVLRVSYGERSFLLTGDVSIGGQNAVLAHTYPLADVMQLPDHATVRSLSERFLQTVQPRLLVLQSEKGNGRGDPSDATLETLKDYALIRTDTQGTLHLYTDGRTLWFLPEG
jgi:competence protein ComEC